MQKLIPSTGEVRAGPYINLNHRGFKAGERVLFEPEYGKPRIDTIDAMDGNVACIDGARILVTKLYGRAPAGMAPAAEAALIAALGQAQEADPVKYQQARTRIMREHGVR